MALLKLYKPTTPSRRKTSVVNYREVITTNEPTKSLTTRKKTSAGRNNRGKITIRHRGGGSRKILRLVNFKRNFEEGIKVLTVEYDPNRTAFISLVVDLKSGEKNYVLYSEGMKVGETFTKGSEIKEGNQILIKDAPIGTAVSQIEINPGQGAKIVRSAGTSAKVTAKEGKYVTLKLPSGELRKILGECTAVVGRIGNHVHELVRLGKAGRVRHKGFRPTVRGKVMNPVDHPHGGGEARNPIGMKYAKTPWGKHAHGVRTRNKRKVSGKFIVQRRKK